MSLNVELTPALAARLSELAKSTGKDLAEVARDAIEQSVWTADCTSHPEPAGEVDAILERWKHRHRNGIAVVDDSRESIYEGCGE